MNFIHVTFVPVLLELFLFVRWREGYDMVTERISPTAVYVPQFGIVILGGKNEAHGFLNTIDFLQIGGDINYKLEFIPPMLKKRAGPPAVYFKSHIIILDSTPNGVDIETLPFPNRHPQWCHITCREYVHAPAFISSFVVFNRRLIVAGIYFIINLFRIL